MKKGKNWKWICWLIQLNSSQWIQAFYLLAIRFWKPMSKSKSPVSQNMAASDLVIKFTYLFNMKKGKKWEWFCWGSSPNLDVAELVVLDLPDGGLVVVVAVLWNREEVVLINYTVTLGYNKLGYNELLVITKRKLFSLGIILLILGYLFPGYCVPRL